MGSILQKNNCQKSRHHLQQSCLVNEHSPNASSYWCSAGESPACCSCNSSQSFIKYSLDAVNALHLNMSCLFSPLKIFYVRLHPQSLLRGLLPTAAVAASSPLQSWSLPSARGESRAGSCSLSTDSKLRQSLFRHSSLCFFCPLKSVPCGKNIITYLVPLWCHGCSRGAICHAAGQAQSSHSRERGKSRWELLPIEVAAKVLLALVIGNSHNRGREFGYVYLLNIVFRIVHSYFLSCMWEWIDPPGEGSHKPGTCSTGWVWMSEPSLAARSLTQGSDLLCPQPGEWV